MKKKQRSNRLGEALADARTAAGLSQAVLSGGMDYTYNVVTSWENGSKPFYAGEWPRLCALVPGLDLSLVTHYKAELNLGEGRKLKPRPSRLDPKVTVALSAVMARRVPGRALSEVAAEMKMDYVAFWKIASGEANPTTVQFRQLADHFGVDVDVLLGRRAPESAPYAALLALLEKQREEIAHLRAEARDGERIRTLNDLLLARQEPSAA